MTNSIQKTSSPFVPEQFISEVNNLYQKGLAYTILMSFLMASLVTILLWKHISHSILAYWYVSYSVFCFVRYCSYVSYQNRTSVSIQTALIWFNLLIFGALASGVFWSFMAILTNEIASFQHGQLLTFNSFFVIIIAAISTACSIIYSSNPGLMFGFTLSAVLPYSFYLLNHQWSYLVILGVLLLTFYVLQILVYFHMDRMIFTWINNQLFKPSHGPSVNNIK